MISKDGFLFLGLVLLLAWIANALLTLVLSLCLVAIGIMGLCLTMAWVLNTLRDNNVAIPKVFDVQPIVSAPIRDIMLPWEFVEIEAQLLASLGAPQEESELIIVRFLTLVRAHNPADVLLPCMKNGIAQKMKYEYYRKYNTLEYKFNAQDTLAVTDVLRQLDPVEVIDFQNFCAAHS